MQVCFLGGRQYILYINYWTKNEHEDAPLLSRMRIKLWKIGITWTHLHLGRRPNPSPRYPSAPVHNPPRPQTAAALPLFAISGKCGGQLTVTPPDLAWPPATASTLPRPSPTNSLITAHSPKCVCNVGNHFQ